MINQSSSKRRRKATAVLFAAAVSAAALCALLIGPDMSAVQAQSQNTPTPTPITTDDDIYGMARKIAESKALRHPNLDSNLNRILQNSRAAQTAASDASSSAETQDTVAVTIYIEEGYSEAVSQFLTGRGASPRNVGTDYIEVDVPVALLPEVSSLEGVRRVRTITERQSAQGSVIGEGIGVHGADAWHEAGIKGEGVKIGIFDDFIGFRGLMGTEVPSTVLARCYTESGTLTSDLADCELGNSHGTAVTEAVFDIAPGASYYISNPVTRGDLKTATEWMVSQGVDVIQVALAWPWEGPGDGTTPFSNGALRSVDAAVEGGAVWVNSAGNGNGRTWYGNSNRLEVAGFDFSLQIFDVTGDTCNEVHLNAGKKFTAQLRWDDVWSGATRDLDLVLFDASLEIVASSIHAQSGGPEDDPFELLSYTPVTGGPHCLAVVHYGGTAPGWIQLQSFTQQGLQHTTDMGSIDSPAESSNPGLLAVGAAAWDNTTEIEDLSSRGPTPDGRVKPDIVGADGANSSTLGAWEGTSQASAHVAGLAALVKNKFPAYTPQRVNEYLKTHAESRGALPNNIWGYGFARLAASDASTTTPVPTPISSPEPTQTPEPTPEPEPTDGCVVTLAGSATVEGTWDDSCLSDRPALQGDGERYARFYNFTLNSSATVTVTLTSEQDTYLYLTAEGVEHENDDESSSNTNSRLEVQLQAGTYTIEATTYNSLTAGEFTLVLVIGDSGTQPQPTPPAPTPTPVPPTPVPPTPTPASGYVDVSRGTDHACALHSDGSITCWGADDEGQATPPATGRFIAISSSDKGTCAVRDNGEVLCWGSFTVATGGE